MADCPSELFYKSLWMIYSGFFPSRLSGLFPLDATDDTSDLHAGMLGRLLESRLS